MAYQSLTDLNLVTILSNSPAGEKPWIPVANDKLEKAFVAEMSYVRFCAGLFGVDWAEAKNTYLLKAVNGVVQKVYVPRIQTNVEGQLVVAWGQVLQPINPEDIGTKYTVTGTSDNGFFLEAHVDNEDDLNEYKLSIAFNFVDYADAVPSAKALTHCLKGKGDIPLKDLIFCRAGMAQKIDVLDEHSTYQVTGYEIKENAKYKKLDVIMDIEGVGKVRGQGNCKQFILKMRPEITKSKPAKLETFDKVAKKGAFAYIQVSNRLTVHQSDDFTAFSLDD